MYDIQIQTGYRCNWDCLVCDSKHNMNEYKNESSKYDFNKFINVLKLLNDVEVSFGYGTESTIDPSFKEKYNSLIENGIKEITVVTNGSMIKKLYNDGFKFNENTSLIISVLGGLRPPRSYSNITGKSFNYIIDLVKFLNSQGIKPALSMSQDFEEITSLKIMLDLLDDLKFDLIIRKIKPVLGGFIGEEKLKTFLDNTGIYYVLDFLNHNVGLNDVCPFKNRIPFLNNGTFAFCCFHSKIIGDINNQDVNIISNNIKNVFSLVPEKINDCKICKELIK